MENQRSPLLSWAYICHGKVNVPSPVEPNQTPTSYSKFDLFFSLGIALYGTLINPKRYLIRMCFLLSSDRGRAEEFSVLRLTGARDHEAPCSGGDEEA